jgi:hypothetical protein
MRIETQFSVFLINKPGVLAAVTGALAKARVNISALALMDSGEHGALRIVCDDADKARAVLSKAHDRWTETDVLVLELSNEPGAFSTVAGKLSAEHLNISYAYCTGGAAGGKTTAVFKVGDIKKAMKVLGGGRQPHKEPRGTVKKPPDRKPPGA